MILFSLKTHLVKLSHQGFVLRELCTFKTFGLPGPASLFIFWKYNIFGFLGRPGMKYQNLYVVALTDRLTQGNKIDMAICPVALSLEFGVWGLGCISLFVFNPNKLA